LNTYPLFKKAARILEVKKTVTILSHREFNKQYEWR